MNEFFGKKQHQDEDSIVEELVYNNIDWDKDVDKLNIIHLFGKQRLEDIQSKISKATGLAFITVDYKGEPVTEATYFTEFCTIRRSDPEQVVKCKASDAFGSIQAAVTKKPSVYFCPCGLLEVAIPIIIDGHYLGGFIGGQVRCSDAPEDAVHLNQVIRLGSNENTQGQQCLQQVPLYSYESFQDVANLVFMIINLLTENEINRRIEKEELKHQISKMTASRQKHKKENITKNAMLEELKSKLNPYGLIDLLGLAANYSIIEEATKTNEIVMKIIDFLRSVFLFQEVFATLEEEMKPIKLYLEMQKEKYGDALEYEIIIPDDMEAQMIPAYVLMPFIQNAIFFGTALSQQVGRLSLKMEYQGEYVRAQIMDNGPGMSLQEKDRRFAKYNKDYEGHGICQAMENAKQKLKRLYGDQAGIVLKQSKKEGCRCIIYYPKHYDERTE